MNDRLAKAETIFHEALDLPPEQREAFLQQACGEDAELCREITALLQASGVADEWLKDADCATIEAPGGISEGPGTVIGRYKLREKVGEGGCGVVYVAEQEEPVRRRVALKVIKLGMDTRAVVARFEAERQALAMMDHPNIAKVFDAGTTDTGRPYFVMELVRGIRITDYCDQDKLPVRGRLDLFIQVCHAVQHAHQKGIIHRDLKPSNILVTLHDGVPMPKVIDFGIAKATEGRLTEATIYTQLHQFLGTPAYMSPEQAEMSGLDIDTRSDIYSLGVLLYELLTGVTPFDAKTLLQSGLDEMRRTIREVEPVKPSTRLTQELASVGKWESGKGGEATDPQELRRLIPTLRGDLDWIVMKCLEKNRTRRYETASGLAADLTHHLDHEPVVARPPCRMYRLGKLVRRNRLAFAAGTSVTLALLAGITLSAWQAERARRAEQTAKSERDSAQAVLSFFQEKVLAAGRPGGQEGGLGKDVTLRKAIDAAEPQIGASFKDQPLVEAAVRNTLGESYTYLGEPELAIRQDERALALRQKGLGSEHPDTVESMNNLASGYARVGKLDQAIPLHEETLRLYKAKLGADHPKTLTSMNNLASDYVDAGNLDRAIPLHEETLRLSKAKLGPYHRHTLVSMNNLASAYRSAGRLDQAMTLHEETLRLCKAKLGPDHPSTLQTMNGLALAYESAGRPGQAITLEEETLRLSKAKLGPDHPVTLSSMNNLALSYESAGRPDQAITLYEETLKLKKIKLGPDHPSTLQTMNNLAGLYNKTRRRPEAIALHEETLRLQKTKFGLDHPDTLLTMNNLAVAYRDARRHQDAIALYEETLKLQKAKLGLDHPHTLNTMNNLAVVYNDTGRRREAIALWDETLKLRKTKLGVDHPDTHRTMNDLGWAYWRAGSFEQSIALFGELLKLRKLKLEPDHPDTLATMNGLGLAYWSNGRFDEAITLHEETLKLRKARLGPEDLDTIVSMHNLALAYQSGGRIDEAITLHEETLKLQKAKLGVNHRDTLNTLYDLGRAYRRIGKLDQAEAYYRERLARPDSTSMRHLGELLLERAKTNSVNPSLAQKQRREGEQLLRDYLAEGRKRYTNDPAKLEERLYDLADFRYRRGDFAEAEPLYWELAQSRRARLDAEDKDVLEPTASLGRLLADWAWAERPDRGRPPSAAASSDAPRVGSSRPPHEKAREAEQFLRECLAIRLRGTNSTHWRIADAKSRLGGAILSMAVTDPVLNAEARVAKLAEAEFLLLDGNEQVQRSFAESKYKRDSVERLVRLYEAWDKPDKVSEWRQKLETFDKTGNEPSASEEEAIQ